MDSALHRSDAVRPVALAVTMTALAEAFYFVVWGLYLFPEGSILGKLVWTLTCGIAMGSVIGSATIMLVVGRLEGAAALVSSALTFFVVASTCAVLCSSIDARFGYFGGAENAELFVLAGVIPGAFGAIVYALLLFSAPGRGILQRMGLGR